MLSVVQDVLIRPLPYAHSDRLYAIWASSESTGQTRSRRLDRISWIISTKTDRLLIWLNTSRVLHLPGLEMANRNSSLALQFRKTSSRCLGIRPYLGRLYEPREYTYLENDTLIVSYNFWKNQLGGDPHVIGRVVHFEGVSETIVGVLPPLSDLFPDTDVWPKHTVRPSWPYMKWRGNKFLRVMGELKPGVTPAMAEEDLTAILRRVPEEPRDVRVHLFR